MCVFVVYINVIVFKDIHPQSDTNSPLVDSAEWSK